MRATPATLFSLFVAGVSAVGNSTVINNSLDTIYLWSEGDEISEQIKVAPGTSFTVIEILLSDRRSYTAFTHI